MKKLTSALKQHTLLKDTLLLMTIIVLFTISFILWGKIKCVNFCDEIYTYILSNSDNEFLTFQLEPGRWYLNGETNQILSANEGFDFAQVMLNNKGDVHPPMYYFVIHFMSVLVSGSSSKWIGLAANWIFAVITLIFLFVFICQVTGYRSLAYAMCLVYVSSPAIISMNMLIRMYAMFSMWVFLFLYILYWIYKGKKNVLMYFLLAAVTFLGFLTQYYFAIICILISFFYGINCLLKRQWKEIFVYAGSLAAAVIAATVFWKTWIKHMFSGYLGGAVVENAFNFAKIIDDIRYGFIHLFTLMYGRLGVAAGVLLLAAAVCLIIKKDKRIYPVMTLIATALIYSIAVVHLTPVHLLSYRYFFPVVLMAYLGEFFLIYFALENLLKKHCVVLTIALCLIVAGLNFIRPLYDKDSVSYVDLHGRYADLMELLGDNSQIPWIYYGYENAVMAELFYDSMMAEKFMVLNNDTAFTDRQYTEQSSQLLLFVQEGTSFERDAFLNFRQYFSGTLVYEPITRIGKMVVYKVTHTVY